MSNQEKTKMPALFVGHGNPMNSISDNSFTRSWATLGKALPKPRVILAISAHWYVPETSVTAMTPPRTIHDFYGFPKELFEVEYPVPGSPELAERIADLVNPDRVTLDYEWGIDHGTWSVLRHIYPGASTPVVQLSLNVKKTPEEHYQLGLQLRELRKEGVLIVGSGNIVHNLAGFDWRNPSATPPNWAVDFEEWNRSKLLSRKPHELIDYLQTGEMAVLSAPSPDHYLPLIYLASLCEEDDEASFPVEGFDGGTMSMLSVLLTD